MADRHNRWYRLAHRKQVTLKQWAGALLNACKEVETENGDPQEDPCICLMVHAMAFQTHADSLGSSGYDLLREICLQNVNLKSPRVRH